MGTIKNHRLIHCAAHRNQTLSTMMPSAGFATLLPFHGDLIVIEDNAKSHVARGVAIAKKHAKKGTKKQARKERCLLKLNVRQPQRQPSFDRWASVSPPRATRARDTKQHPLESPQTMPPHKPIHSSFVALCSLSNSGQF